MSKNWKTTLCAVASLASVAATCIIALVDDNSATVPDWTSLAATATTAIGLIFAKDAAPKDPS